MARRRGRDPMPNHIRPMLATLVREPFDRNGWYFETKWDGYRAIAEITVRDVKRPSLKVKLYSRNGIDFSKRYAPIMEALGKIRHSSVLDGEIIALKKGKASAKSDLVLAKPDFHALQNYERTPVPLQYAVFDLLYLDGKDLRGKPLSERKKRLRSILPHDEHLLFSEHVEDQGRKFFKLMRSRGLEGMVAKDSKSPYREGFRGKDWLKVKNINKQEAVIIGFTKPRGSRKHLGALVLGAYDNGRLRYIGHSGGGFTERELAELHTKLSKIAQKTAPLKERVPINSPITWVKPKYVCECTFTEWTPEGYMRHPVYAGLRTDKKPEEVVREFPGNEEARSASRLKGPGFTHLSKVFWPEEGYTKGDFIEYYGRTAEIILPYLKDRPQNLNRHPNGWKGKSFYQKNVSGAVPPYAKSVKIWSDTNRKNIEYLICDNKETLLYMANLGCIEINPWSSRIENLERPDYMIFDIDPNGRSFDDVIVVAQAIRRILDPVCKHHYPKTSGKTGLHILVPLGGRYHYEAVRLFAELIMRLVHRKLPEITSIERSPTKRRGKIYLDYLQNRIGQTIAAPYSVRPFAGATVSTPLEWSEVKKGLDPKKFTIKTIDNRLKQKGDLMKPMLTQSVDLEKAVNKLGKELRSEI